MTPNRKSIISQGEMWYIFYIFANMYIIIISLASNGKQEKPHLVETRCTSSPFGKPKNFNIRNIINFATEGFCLCKIHKILPDFLFLLLLL